MFIGKQMSDASNVLMYTEAPDGDLQHQYNYFFF